MSAGLALPAVSMSEAQAFVRIETGEEEALLAGMVRTAGGWRYVAPVDGLSALVRSSGLRADYAGGWDIGVIRAASVEIDGDAVLSTRSAAIASPGGGAIIDSEARSAINQILAALRHHGMIAT
jgi:hypothetical protein